MAGLDLSGVARVLDDWIVDVAVITRDNGSADDQLNEDTGLLEAAADQELYRDRAALLPGTGGGVEDPDTQQVSDETGALYRMLIPHGLPVPQVRAGDVVQWVEANGTTPDPLLLRRRFEVDDLASVSSFSVGTFIPLRQTGIVTALESP